jgi:hypothetical protein
MDGCLGENHDTARKGTRASVKQWNAGLDFTRCPDAEALARLVDGWDSRDPLISHLDQCRTCFRVFVDSHRFLGEARASSRSNLVDAKSAKSADGVE